MKINKDKKRVVKKLLAIKEELDSNPDFQRKVRELGEKYQKLHSLKPEDLKKVIRG